VSKNIQIKLGFSGRIRAFIYKIKKKWVCPNVGGKWQKGCCIYLPLQKPLILYSDRRFNLALDLLRDSADLIDALIPQPPNLPSATYMEICGFLSKCGIVLQHSLKPLNWRIEIPHVQIDKAYNVIYKSYEIYNKVESLD
jgi:hypothetical protein